MADEQNPIDSAAISSTFIKPQLRKPHDTAVTFEEYHHYALRTRAEEQTFEAPKTEWRHIVLRKKNPIDSGNNVNDDTVLQTSTELKISQPASNHVDISDEEWTNASRAFRTASWGACEFNEDTIVLQ